MEGLSADIYVIIGSYLEYDNDYYALINTCRTIYFAIKGRPIVRPRVIYYSSRGKIDWDGGATRGVFIPNSGFSSNYVSRLHGHLYVKDSLKICRIPFAGSLSFSDGSKELVHYNGKVSFTPSIAWVVVRTHETNRLISADRVIFTTFRSDTGILASQETALCVAQEVEEVIAHFEKNKVVRTWGRVIMKNNIAMALLVVIIIVTLMYIFQ